jgi:hypothetical protein
MAEPANLFQPTKSISMLWSLTQQTAQVGMESSKELLQGSTAVVTGAITDITEIWKDIANIWIDPPKQGEGIFEPKQPIEQLSSISSKVMQTWVTVAEGTVSTGVNVAKQVLGTWTNIIKKGLWIFRKREEW